MPRITTRSWTPEEDAAIREAWASGPHAARRFAAAYPNRTEAAAKRRAVTIKAVKPRIPWTVEEDEAIRAAYAQSDQFTSTWFTERFPHRTKTHVKERARHLGIAGYAQRVSRPAFEDATETDWAYLAGIVDGEGTIGWPTTLKPVVLVANTSLPLIEWLQQTFPGCKVYTREPHAKRPEGGAVYRRKLQYRVVWAKHNYVRTICERMMPYLTIKRESAEKALTVLGTIGVGKVRS